MPHRPNGSYVSNSDALSAWTPLAHAALLETARSYRAVITDEHLAARVQRESGILHDQPAAAWIDRLLDRVAAEARRLDEPPLDALCVGGSDDSLKAQRRLECYRAYAADVPADGGIPEVHRRIARPAASGRTPRPRVASTPRPRIATAPRLREVTCTNCFLIVPDGPTCTSCGAALGA